MATQPRTVAATLASLEGSSSSSMIDAVLVGPTPANRAHAKSASLAPIHCGPEAAAGVRLLNLLRVELPSLEIDYTVLAGKRAVWY